MSVILDVQGLTISFPSMRGGFAPVRDVNFSVSRGETLCIVGESGCGKSLTALALMGLLPQRAQRTARRLTFGGRDLQGLSEHEMGDIRGLQMSMIFQEPMTSLNPAYTIGEQLVETYLRHKKARRSEAVDRAVHLLEMVGISAAAGRLRQYPHQLSGGLRQRIMIAMALMCGPDLIIADEPTTALDVTIQAQILHLLKSLQGQFHMGVILITHDLGIVARVASRVAVMYAGQVVESGAVNDVFAAPRHPYTNALMRCIPIPGRTRRGEHLGSIPGMVPTLVGDLGGCHFRNRCTYAHEACVGAEIPFRVIDEGRGYRCLRGPDSLDLDARRRAAYGDATKGISA